MGILVESGQKELQKGVSFTSIQQENIGSISAFIQGNLAWIIYNILKKSRVL